MLPTLVLGTVRLSTYWLMFTVGVVSMAVLSLRRRERYGLSVSRALLATLLITLFGLVGAKLLGAVQNWEQVQIDGLSAAGFSFFGAVFMVPVGLMFFARFLRATKPMVLDVAAPCLASMVAFMRVGCFLSGCCGGLETELFGFRFHWPTQMIESIGDFIVLGVILQAEEQEQHKGKLYAIFLTGYGILRFFVEFLRDTDKRLLGLGDGQWFAIIAVLIGTIVLSKKNISNKSKRGE